MDTYADSLKQKLTSLIREMSAAPAPYVTNPERDFTRKKKLPFETVMQLLISMGGNSIYKELLESQGYDVNTATTSAFVQQRNQILKCGIKRVAILIKIEQTGVHCDGLQTTANNLQTTVSQPIHPPGIPLLHLTFCWHSVRLAPATGG